MSERFYDAITKGDLEEVKSQLGITSARHIVEGFEVCAMRGHLHIMKYLFDLIPEQNFRISLENSIQHGQLEVLKFLIEKGADLETCRDFAFHFCITNNYYEMVEYLAGLGFDINQRDIHIFGAVWDLPTARALIGLGCKFEKNNFVAYDCGSGWCGVLEELHTYLLSILPNKDQFDILQEKKCLSIQSTVQKRLVVKKNLQKNSALKFILKPSSLHMQLSSIE
jgi:hypothetical protein